MSKKHKKKIRFSGLIFVILLLYLIGVSVYYVVKLPVKNIKVTGVHLLTEGEVIQSVHLEDSFPMIKLTKSYLKNEFKNIPLIKDFKLKRNLKGQVTIIIEEAKVLFYYNYDNKIVLSNGKRIEDEDRFLGYPTLVNYVPSEIYHNFVKNFSKVDSDIIAMISEIEYDPDVYNDVVIDNERFLLLMNDGNKVYINVANVEKINKYQSVVYKTDQIGTLYLDSNGKNFIFKIAGNNED